MYISNVQYQQNLQGGNIYQCSDLNSNKYLRERSRVLRFSVEFQFVLPVESFLTEGASEGFLPCVDENMPGEMVSLLEGAATLAAPVFSLDPVVVQLHHGNILDGKQGRSGLENYRMGSFGIFQFVRPELHVGPLERFRFNGESVNMICIE